MEDIELGEEDQVQGEDLRELRTRKLTGKGEQVIQQVSFGRLYPAATHAFESNLPKLYLFHNPLH